MAIGFATGIGADASFVLSSHAKAETAESGPWNGATGRQNYFDALRLILALVVVVAHAYLLVQGNYFGEPGYWWMSERFLPAIWRSTASLC